MPALRRVDERGFVGVCYGATSQVGRMSWRDCECSQSDSWLPLRRAGDKDVRSSSSQKGAIPHFFFIVYCFVLNKYGMTNLNFMLLPYIVVVDVRLLLQWYAFAFALLLASV